MPLLTLHTCAKLGPVENLLRLHHKLHCAKLAGAGVVILESETIEAERYFVFFYQSKRFLETNDWSSMLAGNAPVIVDKLSGKRFTTGTAHPIGYYLNIYENSL
jgi:hypothetical protein